MKLIWLDLETEGLDPKQHRILEVAVHVADFHDPWNAVPAYHAVLGNDHVAYANHDAVYVKDVEIDKAVALMHTQSGLWAECAASPVTLADAEEALLGLVAEVADKDERPILAGSTISFDHGFVREHLPRVAARLSYRHYDVRTIALFCRSLGMPAIPKAGAHRADADIRESIALGKACDTWLREYYRSFLRFDE